MEYQQKRDVPRQLVDAASAVANSVDSKEARTNAQRHATLYFGKAHIFVIDSRVNEAKIAFYKAMNSALAKGEFHVRRSNASFNTGVRQWRWSWASAHCAGNPLDLCAGFRPEAAMDGCSG